MSTMMYLDVYNGVWMKTEASTSHWVLLAAQQRHLNHFNIFMNQLPYEVTDIAKLQTFRPFTMLERTDEVFKFDPILRPGEIVKAEVSELHSFKELGRSWSALGMYISELTIVGDDPADSNKVIFTRKYSMNKTVLKAAIDNAR